MAKQQNDWQDKVAGFLSENDPKKARKLTGNELIVRPTSAMTSQAKDKDEAEKQLTRLAQTYEALVSSITDSIEEGLIQVEEGAQSWRKFRGFKKDLDRRTEGLQKLADRQVAAKRYLEEVNSTLDVMSSFVTRLNSPKLLLELEQTKQQLKIAEERAKIAEQREVIAKTERAIRDYLTEKEPESPEPKETPEEKRRKELERQKRNIEEKHEISRFKFEQESRFFESIEQKLEQKQKDLQEKFPNDSDTVKELMSEYRKTLFKRGFTEDEEFD